MKGEQQVGTSQKLNEAKRYLGKSWVAHPEYRFNPRHSTNLDVWAKAREIYVAAVRIAAKMSRERNPAYIRTQTLGSAASGCQIARAQ